MNMKPFGIHSNSPTPSPTQSGGFLDTPSSSRGHKKALSFSMSGRSESGSNGLLTPTLKSGHLQSASETTPKSSALSPNFSTTSHVVASPEPLEKAFEEPPQKLKIATLHPAPHHPKIVAQLKVPFPLPDVDLNNANVIRRKPHKAKEGGEASHKDSEHVLCAEEIKDVICSTAFWLIVREGFGGVGKEKRKGDGWRIRA